MRERDGQPVLYLPAGGTALRDFLIDQYPITNAQYAQFLNLPEVQAESMIVDRQGIHILTSLDERLIVVADARSFWEKWPSSPKPAPPWGVTFESGTWQPLTDCARLPVTLVTAWGASWYATWTNGSLLSPHGTNFDYLPRESQWVTAT